MTGIVSWAAQRQKAIVGQALTTAQGLMAREDVQALCLECGPATRRNSSASASWIDRLLAYSFSSAPR